MNISLARHSEVQKQQTLRGTKQLVNEKASTVSTDNESDKIGNHHHDNIQNCTHTSNVSVPRLLTKLEKGNVSE